VPSPGTLTIDIVSDVICPWCFIGKRRLESALKLLGNPSGVRVNWKPFQLNPQMPPQGIERRACRTARFGSWEKSQALDAQIAAAGAEEGITFAFRVSACGSSSLASIVRSSLVGMRHPCCLPAAITFTRIRSARTDASWEAALMAVGLMLGFSGASSKPPP
jgi:hypothetical protein